MQSLLITVDALRADHLAQFGYSRDTMPALDRLFNDGHNYTEAFSNGALTKTSVPSLLTSRYHGHNALQEGPTVASVLSSNNIRTAMFHSSVLLLNEFERIYGFQESYSFNEESWTSSATFTQEKINQVKSTLGKYFGEKKIAKKLYGTVFPDRFKHTQVPYVKAEAVAKKAVRWIEQNKNNDFFVWIHFMDPHRPYGVSSEEMAYHEEITDQKRREVTKKASTKPDTVTEEEKQMLIDMYDSDLAYLSKELECFFNELERIGIYSDANIIFTADHGEEFGEHGEYFHTNYPYDELIHVPLVYKTDDRSSDSNSKLRQLIDIPPTVVTDHGLTIPDNFEGTHLNCEDKRDIVSVGGVDQWSIAVRTKDWKLIIPEDSKTELYNVRSDPEERRSVTSDTPNVVDELTKRVPEEVAQSRVSLRPSKAKIEKGTKKKLENLGYLE